MEEGGRTLKAFLAFLILALLSFPSPAVANEGSGGASLDPKFQELEANLRAEIENSRYDIAIAVTDIQTGQTIGVKKSEPRLLGCTINFFVLLTVMREIDRGVYRLDEVEWDVVQTATYSNASTARWLIYKLGDGDARRGIAKINQLLADIGLKSGPHPATFRHPPGYWWEPGGDEHLDNSLTPEQATYALAKLYRGEIISPIWRDYLFMRMRGVYYGLNYLIPAGVDRSQAGVAHKNGFYPDSAHGWVDNDIGIVTFERGGKNHAYSIALYMQDIPRLYENIWEGQKLSRMVWEFFNEKYK